MIFAITGSWVGWPVVVPCRVDDLSRLGTKVGGWAASLGSVSVAARGILRGVECNRLVSLASCLMCKGICVWARGSKTLACSGAGAGTDEGVLSRLVSRHMLKVNE